MIGFDGQFVKIFAGQELPLLSKTAEPIHAKTIAKKLTMPMAFNFAPVAA